jgi:NAD(P)-dependent dehydrogenase (short-subunit alcohol dehydrogenase family)
MSKTWLITGSSRGLGRALAEAVLGAGDNLVATARNTRGLEDLSDQYANQVILRPLDVTDFGAAKAAVNAAVERFGRLDVVANVAGYGNLGPIEDTSIEDFRAQIDTNLFGPIHFSSVGGRIGSTGRAPYSAAKFGVEGFSEAMVTELAPLGVKVTVFEPGGFRTDFAGSSQTIHKIRPEYDATVGQAARFQRDYDGKQPGDPAKAAQAILKVVGMDDPPLRLLLGSDAVRIVESADARKAEADRQWSDLSVSTDFAVAS